MVEINRGDGSSETLQPPSLRQQFEMLDLYVQKGTFWEIQPPLFPDIKPLSILLARFYACSNLISSLGMIRENTQNAQAKEGLGQVMTKLIEDREADVVDILGKMNVPAELDEARIAHQARFTQGMEDNSGLDAAIRLGLVEQISGKNFPALRALSERELTYLRLTSLGNRLATLKTFGEGLKQIGLSPSVTNKDDLRQWLNAEIQTVEQQYSQLMTSYLADNQEHQ